MTWPYVVCLGPQLTSIIHTWALALTFIHTLCVTRGALGGYFFKEAPHVFLHGTPYACILLAALGYKRFGTWQVRACVVNT